MAYTYDKQLWKDYPDTSTPITAERLNHIEDGISEAAKSGGGDTIPVGSEFDYDGIEVPEGFEQVSDPKSYSTEEQVIGTWIDGKTLYRKTIEFTTSSTVNTWKQIDNISDVEKCIKHYGYIIMSTTEMFLIPDYTQNAPYFGVNKNNNTIKVAHTNSGISNKTCVVTFEYTKTTD